MENKQQLVGPLEQGRLGQGVLMLVLSFNARGLGRSPKIKALRRMIDILKPTIIFIQETMMEGEKAKEVLEPWLKG